MEQQDEIYRKLEIEASKNYILPANNFLGVKEGQNPLLLGMRAYHPKWLKQISNHIDYSEFRDDGFISPFQAKIIAVHYYRKWVNTQ